MDAALLALAALAGEPDGPRVSNLDVLAASLAVDDCGSITGDTEDILGKLAMTTRRWRTFGLPDLFTQRFTNFNVIGGSASLQHWVVLTLSHTPVSTSPRS